MKSRTYLDFRTQKSLQSCFLAKQAFSVYKPKQLILFENREIVAAYGVEAFRERRWYGSDWLHTGFYGDRRSGLDRRSLT